ncbi:hypothetical protein [Methylomonas rhizoryzae]|uniref:hypothetical protein n=1 Tax=Methylomonas rhizoryzae TaxID=2608981 RepID=UPI001680E608|nr:hypothetical protein [Methylomonas rhizoryzae]
MRSDNIKLIKPAKASYVVFAVIWAIPGLLGLAVAIKQGNWLFPGLWIGLLGEFFSFLIIRRFRILVTKDKLIYRRIVGSNQVRLSAICKMELKSPDYTHRLGPTMGLYVYTAGNSEPAFVINAKLFSWKDIRFLLDLPGSIHESTRL